MQYDVAAMHGLPVAVQVARCRLEEECMLAGMHVVQDTLHVLQDVSWHGEEAFQSCPRIVLHILISTHQIYVQICGKLEMASIVGAQLQLQVCIR